MLRTSEAFYIDSPCVEHKSPVPSHSASKFSRSFTPPFTQGGFAECAICLDPMTNGGEHHIVALLCGHTFGENCIKVALQCNPHCPKCRQSVSLQLPEAKSKRKRSGTVAEGVSYIKLFDLNAKIQDNNSVKKLFVDPVEVEAKSKRILEENEQLKRVSEEQTQKISRLSDKSARLSHLNHSLARQLEELKQQQQQQSVMVNTTALASVSAEPFSEVAILKDQLLKANTLNEELVNKVAVLKEKSKKLSLMNYQLSDQLRQVNQGSL